MSGLGTYSATSFPELYKSATTEISAGLLYYLSRGRNAWHYTWVRHYFSGCLHATLGSAKAQAERMRTQGSTFTIEEQPALVFRSEQGVLLVTQINTDHPLSGYLAKAIGEAPQGAKKIEGALDNYMCVGAPIEGIVKSFAWSSRFWKTRPPLRNSVIIVASRAPDEAIEPLRKRQLKRWQSQSYGGQFHLGWTEGVHSMKPAALRRLVAGTA